jgi:NADH-quinone oxidoreductase subunit H
MNDFISASLVINIVLGAILGGCSYLIYVERRLAAFIQDRVGPNRTGPAGLLQPIADGIKLFIKEDVIPGHVNLFLFILGPSIAVFTTMLAYAVVPFGPPDQIQFTLMGMNLDFRFIIAPQIDIGMVFIFAVGSLAVYGIILGGWASNNKYSMLGSLRASAQVVSYEIPLGMSIVGLGILTGSLNLERLVLHQAEQGFWGWNFWAQPVACLIFFVAALAEANRLPFDLSECEQELVGGFHTEYSSMKFALYFLAEYTHVILVSLLTTLLFFGGWQFPLIAEVDSAYTGSALVKVGVLLSKAFCVIILIMFLRWTLPRFRFDQLMGLAWKVLIPLGTANVVMVMTVKHFELPTWWMFPLSLGLVAVVGVLSVPNSKTRYGALGMAGGRTRIAADGVLPPGLGKRIPM